MPCITGTMVEQLSTDSEFKGSNTTTAQHQELNIMKKCLALVAQWQSTYQLILNSKVRIHPLHNNVKLEEKKR